MGTSMVGAMVVFFVIGIAALVRGVALLSVPAAWMVSGVICLGLAAWPLVRGR